MDAPHMVKQTITYSDGTETVINYRGVIVDGILKEDNPVHAVEETVETPEVVEETTEEAEEAPAESVEETA